MLFTSIDFLIFFALLLAVLACVRDPRARQAVVLAASYVFYAAWDWRLLSLLWACSLWNWALAIHIEDARTEAGRRTALWLAVALNIAALGYFKYAGFFVQSFTSLFHLRSEGALKIILPLGISFFTFQGVAYVADVYRRAHAPVRSLPDFLFFKAFFPQLIAGPIVRAGQFMPQIERGLRFRPEMIASGAQAFLLGALTKLVFADNLAVCADQVFAKPGMYDAPTLWLGLLSYAGQIYCDFFGYSMMAIGLARILGYRLPMNFRMPYVSRSIQEFWRRWHITLSNWLRDYLYISLGGSRRGDFATYGNLLLTMLIGGLWHGASWTFVLWGGLHGLALVINRLWPKPLLGGTAAGSVLGWALNFGFVTLAWLPFRAHDFGSVVVYLTGLVGIGGGRANWMYAPALVALGLLAVWHLAYVLAPEFKKRQVVFRRWDGFAAVGANLAAVAAIALYAPLDQTPFIYFQF